MQGKKLFFFFPRSWPGAVKKNLRGSVEDIERQEKLLPCHIVFHRHELYTTVLTLNGVGI